MSDTNWETLKDDYDKACEKIAALEDVNKTLEAVEKRLTSDLLATKAALAESNNRRDHYHEELKKLQAARGSRNRTKARRLARAMVASGEVAAS